MSTRFAAASLGLVVAACAAPVPAPPSVATAIGAQQQEATTTTVSCVALPVFQSDDAFGPPTQVVTSSVWVTEWATIEVTRDVSSGEEVDRWALPAIDGEALVRVTDGGLAALVDLGAGPCNRFGVLSTGEIADAVSDALHGFLEGLKPLNQLPAHLAAIDEASRPPSCPAGPAAPVTPGTVHSMLLCGGALPVYPVTRQVPEGADPIEAAVLALVDGPTRDERESGLVGAFDGVDPKPDIRVEFAEGELVLRFELSGEPWAPGSVVSTSSQSMAFMDTLFATAFQFDEVDAVTLDTCIGEVGCSIRTTRSTFEEMQSVNWGVAFTEGCGFAGYWSDPSCTAPTE